MKSAEKAALRLEPGSGGGRPGGGLRIPVATYRIQFHRGFPFRSALALLDYFRDLGVSDLYASPFLRARPGSLHGYDVVDPAAIHPEIGTEEDLRILAEGLAERGMGLVMDVVPNHMCVTDDGNAWWTDVLGNGPSSPYASFFDIDWRPPKPDLENKVLLPVLGDQYGRVLENQEIQVAYEEGAFLARHGERHFPIAPRTAIPLLQKVLETLRSHVGDSRPEILELESILTALEHLPARTETNPEKVRERQREKEVVRRRLAALVEGSEEVRRALEERLVALNGRKGDPRSFDDLETLLADQAYRLCFWRVAADEINYRRFFDVNDLAAIRVEEPEVFAKVHELPFRLVERGWVTGLRVDHVDGLLDPEGYLRRLQGGGTEGGEGPGLSRFVVVEKVLCGEERLPASWPVHGTTGYEFLNLANGLFVERSAERALRSLYRRFAGRADDVEELVASCKKLILLVSLASELHVLAGRLDRISEQHRWSRDFTLESLRFALREVIAYFPVYRSYLRPGDDGLREEDRRHVEEAVRRAKRRNPATDPSLFDFVRQVWLLEHPGGLSESQREERRAFVLRLQQLTGPVMAKGFEDTFCYRHYPLASSSEVGGEPKRFAVSVEEFHRAMEERLEVWPHALSATSTHDTKRSEDVRCRIDALSEIPGPWSAAIGRWRRLAAKWRGGTLGSPVPNPNEEYLFYQTLVGTWPAGSTDRQERRSYVERIEAYMIKAIREAKSSTSWIHPNEPYEEAVRRFVRCALDPTTGNRFVEDLARFVEPVSGAGMLNSLSQTLLKIAAPGVPDFYQGTEIWDGSLVDPDNRRPVDFARRRSLLRSLRSAGEGDRASFVRGLLERPEDGRIKLFVTSRGLEFRGAKRDLFEKGRYRALEAVGSRRDHVCAFARSLGDEAAVVVVGRFFLRLGAASWPPLGPEIWGESVVVLPEGLARARFRDVLTGRVVEPREGERGSELPLGEIFRDLTVALLDRLA